MANLKEPVVTVGRRKRGATLRAIPSLGAAIVVVGVLIANSWWLLRSEPEPAQMDEVARLQALQKDRDLAVQAAAIQAAQVAQPAPTPQLVIPPNTPRPLELSEAEVKAEPQPPRPVPVERSAVLDSGETLSAVLERMFVPRSTAALIIAAYKKVRNPRRLRVGQRFWARFESPSPMDAESLLSLVIAPAGPGQGVTIERQRQAQQTRYVAREGGLPGHLVRRALRCGIIGSLGTSLNRCGHGQTLSARVARVLRARLNLRTDLRPGDELRVVFEELIASGERLRYGHLLAVSYRGRKASLVALYFDDKNGRAGWYDKRGEAIERMFLRRPTEGRLTSTYGMRMHPILHVMKPHLGIDWAAPTGTPVRAAADGKVIKVANGAAAGRNLRMEHASGYQTEYMHLSRFARRSKRGAWVRRGQVIGFVGNTGRSTAPHLHFGARRFGKHIDPVLLRDIPGQGVARKERKAFQERARQLLALLQALGRKAAQAS